MAGGGVLFVTNLETTMNKYVGMIGWTMAHLGWSLVPSPFAWLSAIAFFASLALLAAMATVDTCEAIKRWRAVK